MRGRAFAFHESRAHQFREARTHCRVGNGVRFLETKHVAAARFDTTYSFVRQVVLDFDFNQIAWGRSRSFNYGVDDVLVILDGGSEAPGESALRRQIQSGQQVMIAQRTIIRGFNNGWIVNSFFQNPGPAIWTFGGFFDVPYPAHFEIPIPGAPNNGPGDSGANRTEFDLSPSAWEQTFNLDLIGWP